jgi:hypothetical protein
MTAGSCAFARSTTLLGYGPAALTNQLGSTTKLKGLSLPGGDGYEAEAVIRAPRRRVVEALRSLGMSDWPSAVDDSEGKL